ncbi:MAG: hypothetical protein IJ229_02340 [Clostridia bacterium]|nr:hypothetical protein [Clostridia bacterium]MBR1685261.1 hypothetical protein [Clostridia bacterium]
MADTIERNYWHPAFVGAMGLEFVNDKQHLIFDDEHILNHESIMMDLLIIKKNKSTVINNQIGKIFRRYNIIEYKSPDDGLTIDDYAKTISYAYLYKGLGSTVNQIPFDELTVTMIRDRMPRAFFNHVRELGGSVEQKHPGIFYIHGVVYTPTQFILTRELDTNLHSSLRMLTNRATEDDAERFLKLAHTFTKPGDKNYVNAVLQVSLSANREVFDNLRRIPAMCEALRDFMKEEIDKEIQAAVEKEHKKTIDTERVSMIKSLMRKQGLTAKDAMETLSIPAAEQERYAQIL